MLENQLEAILFALPNPIPLQKLAQILSLWRQEPIEPPIVEKALAALEQRYANTSLEILRAADSYALRVRPLYGEGLTKAMGLAAPIRLSKPLLETLAVIAYHQPTTKAFVSEMRQANSDYAIEKLLELELIEPAGRLNLPGKPLAYRTTHKFLEIAGLTSLDDLPKPSDLAKT